MRIIDNSDNGYLSFAHCVVDLNEPIQSIQPDEPHEPIKTEQPFTDLQPSNNINIALLSQLADLIYSPNSNQNFPLFSDTNLSSPSTNSMDTMSTNSSNTSMINSIQSNPNSILPETLQNLLNPTLFPQQQSPKSPNIKLENFAQNNFNIPTLGNILNINKNVKREIFPSVHMHNIKTEASQTFVCRFKACKDEPFVNEDALKEHYLKYHEVGSEFRLIALATFSTQRKFPRIGLQCPYINCDPSLFFDAPCDVIAHLQIEHNEDLKELMQSPQAQAKRVSTLKEAAAFCMDLGKIPKQFDDKLIYCCPFAKNDICLQECHVDNAEGLVDHLESFHALHREDGQLIINILRFMELKPIWRDWSDQSYTDGMHKRVLFCCFVVV